jgi:hypothetical protein
METEKATASGMEIVAAGTNVEVRVGGAGETVFVRLLAVREYKALSECLDDEIGQVALFTGKPKEWAEGLAAPEHARIIEAARRLNDDFFWAWFDRRMSNMNRLPERLLSRAESAVAAAGSGSRSMSPR